MSWREHGAVKDICLDSIAWFLVFVSGIVFLELANTIFGVGERPFAAVCLGLMVLIAYRTWKESEQGNHPIFLFMVFLILFQYARLVQWVVFGAWSIADFDLTVRTPFTIDPTELKRTLVLIPVSAAFVYLGFFYRTSNRVMNFTSNPEMRRFFGWLFTLTIPFVVYKDAHYLSYALHHGGYAALYFSNGAQEKSVGMLVRGIGLVNKTAFFTYVILEDRRAYLRLALLAFLGVLVLDLLTGFRGEFFENTIFLWMVYNTKVGKSFRPLTGLLIAVGFIFAAVGAEIYRKTAAGPIHGNIVEYLLRDQGVSFYVTASAVMFYHHFHPHIWHYLFNQIYLPYTILSRLPPGALFTLDLTAFLNPHIAYFALGTGEAYLAHLYLIDGLWTVCLGSLIIGLLCRGLTQVRSVYSRTIAFSILLWIPYMPRAGYLEAVATSSKFVLGATSGFALYAVYAWIAHYLKRVRATDV